MLLKIVFSGFGGQGLMSLGKILAKAALISGKHTTCFPSYGAEVRSGTAHCFVKISDTRIGSPIMMEPDIAILLNQPSLDKFEKTIKPGGILILNSDLIQKGVERDDLNVKIFPLSSLALECGNIRVANVIALGLLASLRPELIEKGVIIRVLKELFTNKDILMLNLAAFAKGEKLC